MPFTWRAKVRQTLLWMLSRKRCKMMLMNLKSLLHLFQSYSNSLLNQPSNQRNLENNRWGFLEESRTNNANQWQNKKQRKLGISRPLVWLLQLSTVSLKPSKKVPIAASHSQTTRHSRHQNNQGKNQPLNNQQTLINHLRNLPIRVSWGNQPFLSVSQNPN